MADVKQLFDAGNLTGAIEALTQEVKANPADPARRTFLFELLSFAGHYDRAVKQLDVISHQDTQSEWATQVYQNIVQAEGLRARLYADGLKPEFLLDPPAYVHLHLEAINRLRENKPAEAQALLAQSEETRPTISGSAGDQKFDEFRDCDDVLAPFLELILLREYVWLPIEQVRELEIAKPERPRDLLWAPVRVVLSDGSQRRGYMPTRYPHSTAQADDQIRLGRVTDWLAAEEGPVQGLGQRQFLAGEEAWAMLELPLITLDGP